MENKAKFKVGLCFFVVIFLSGIIFLGYFSRKDHGLVEINGQKFFVEIMVTNTQQALGLGQRSSMKENEGMLFDFGKKGSYVFWMKDMRFNLDIIWIEDRKIVYIAKNIPYTFSGVINPGVVADKVLEIGGGLSEKYNFKAGDEVSVR